MDSVKEFSYEILHNELNYQLDPQSLNRQKFKKINVIAEENERAMRMRLSTSDADCVEKYDQFYRDHKLLLILFRILGVMPILRATPGKMSFSWKSIATIYAIFFWILMTVLVIIVGRERIHILQTTKQFDEYIYAIIFVIYLVPHFWIPFVGWGVAAEVAKYKSSWGTFQLRFYKVTGTTLEFPRLKVLIIILTIACILCAVLFLLLLSLLLDGYPIWHTSAYYHIVIMINMNCSLWYINSRAIRTASFSLAKCFQKDIYMECSSSVVSRYRFLWLNLSELLQSLGNAYARTYSTYCLFMFVNITIAVYGTLAEIFDQKDFSISYKEIGLIVDAIYCCTLLFIFCDCSHKTTLEVANEVQKILLSIDILRSDKETKNEIDFFILAIEMNPAIVSLKGYANVNRELLSSSVGTITIYLLVLIQFKFTLDKATV